MGGLPCSNALGLPEGSFPPNALGLPEGSFPQMPSACPRDRYAHCYIPIHATTINATGLPGGYLRSQLP